MRKMVRRSVVLLLSDVGMVGSSPPIPLTSGCCSTFGNPTRTEFQTTWFHVKRSCRHRQRPRHRWLRTKNATVSESCVPPVPCSIRPSKRWIRPEPSRRFQAPATDRGTWHWDAFQPFKGAVFDRLHCSDAARAGCILSTASQTTAHGC